MGNILDLATQPSSKRFNNLRRYNALQSLGDMLLAYGAPTPVGQSNINAIMQASDTANKRNENIMKMEQQYQQAASLTPLLEQFKDTLNLSPERIAAIQADPVSNLPFLQALSNQNMSTAFSVANKTRSNVSLIKLAKTLKHPGLIDKSEEQLTELASNLALADHVIKPWLDNKMKTSFPEIEIKEMNNGQIAVIDKNSLQIGKDGKFVSGIQFFGDKKVEPYTVTKHSLVDGQWMTTTNIVDKNNLNTVLLSGTAKPTFTPGNDKMDQLTEAFTIMQDNEINKDDPQKLSAEAFIKNAFPNSLSITVGEDGSIQIVQGGSGSDINTKKTQGSLEDKIISYGEDLLKLDGIFQKFDPSFLTAGGQAERFGLKMKDWLAGAVPGIDALDETEKSRLTNMTNFFADVAVRFNQILKEMSGAAVMDGEFQRQKEGQPSKADTPTEFMAKVKSQMKFIIGAMGRMQKLKDNGVSAEIFMEELKKNGSSIMGETVESGDAYVAKLITDKAAVFMSEDGGNYSQGEAVNLAVRDVFTQLNIPMSFLKFYRSSN